MPAPSPEDLPGLVPRPDPTVLTTAALLREIDKLRTECLTADQALEDALGARLNAMDTATLLRLEAVGGIREQTERQIKHLERLHNERFESIALQFQERDIRTDQSARASSEALAAALQAAKELVGAQGEASAAAAVKSETSFTKQIDQLATLIESKDKATDARITELKERIDRGEGTSAGVYEARTDQRLNAGQLTAALGVLLVFISVAVTVALATIR
jgi:hypothetical protein